MGRKKHRNREHVNTKHHKIAQSRGGADIPPNNEPIPDNKHQAIHLLFQNMHTIEKVQAIISMDEAILKDYFRRIIMDVLNLDYKDVFLREAFKNNHAYKNLNNTRTHG